VAGFGIKVTLIEPGGYSTEWGGSSAKHATALPAYDGVREQAANRPSAASGNLRPLDGLGLGDDLT